MWQKMKRQFSSDFDKAKPLSQWRQQKVDTDEEFYALKDITDTETQRNKLAPHKKYKLKNRYRDILPYEHTRVKLMPRPGKEDQNTDLQAYINANFVDGPLQEGDKKIIGSMGPLPHTCSDFWQMISEQNVTLIVTTTNLVEKGKTKLHKFWLDENTDN